MNCSRTKELFSEYIDGLLDKEQEALVKDHLLQCGDCRYEFESMKAVVREMGSLDTIKAPDDFLVSLHGRIKNDSWFQKVKAFLFIPARFRIPVELATLATTVVLAFFIFHILPPMPLNTAPSKSQIDFKDKKSEGVIQSNESAPSAGGMRSPETRAITDKSMPAPRKKQAVLKQAPDLLKINEPLQLVLALKPVYEKDALSLERKEDAAMDREKPDGKKADAAAPVRLKMQALPRVAELAGRAEVPEGGKLEKNLYKAAEKDFSHQEEPLPDIKEHIKSAGGRILKTEVNNETNQPEYLLIEISGQNYQKLVEKLSEFGKIQSPVAGDVSQFKQPIQIRLHLIINNK